MSDDFEIDNFEWESYLSNGLNKYFRARYSNPLAGDAIERLKKTSEIWIKSPDANIHSGSIYFLKDYGFLAILSKKAVKYPHLTAHIIFPNTGLIGNETLIDVILGFNNGSSGFNATCLFILKIQSTGAVLYTRTSGTVGGVLTSINANKPSNILSGRNTYKIEVAKNLVIYYINKKIVNIAIPCGVNGVFVENVLPYSIALTTVQSSAMTAYIGIDTNRTSNAQSDLLWQISPYQVRFSEGHEIIPLSLKLYLNNLDTELNTYSIAAGAITSHPFPIFGYTSKILNFYANQAGTLAVQVYTRAGNWRQLTSQATSANTLLSYSITSNAILARIVFTPDAYPCVINDAEVELY